MKTEVEFAVKLSQRRRFQIMAAGAALLVQMLGAGAAISQPAQGEDRQLANVRDFGAAGDGVTDDTAAFDKALSSLAKAGGGKCFVPRGIYLISAATNPAISAHVSSNVHLVGEGADASILKISGMPAGNFLFCSGDNWSVEGLTIDMQDYFIHRPGFATIVATGTNWSIKNCAIIRIGRTGINIKAGANGLVEGNRITKTTASPLQNAAILGVVDGERNLPTNMHINDNVCVNSLIYFNGRDSVIAGNRVGGSRFGTNICTGVNSDNVSIIGNVCSGGRGRDQTNCVVSGFELWAPDSLIANNYSYDNDGPGITMGGNDCIVIGNRCSDNARLTGNIGGSGIVGRAHARLSNAASGSVFIGNICFDTDWPHGSMTQAYGYNELGAGLNNIQHFGNDYSRNRLGPARYRSVACRPNTLQGGMDAAPPIAPAMRARLVSLLNSGNVTLSDFARRALEEFLKQ
jgi:hypothetical protein